jgi:Pyruvate/2-oxoacid:ferredoxin oxidoreductase gamma subunit
VAASMVMIGAYAAATGLVVLDSLVSSVQAALPSYRHRHMELNVAALGAGYAAVPHDVAPAWSPAAV